MRNCRSHENSPIRFASTDRALGLKLWTQKLNEERRRRNFTKKNSDRLIRLNYSISGHIRPLIFIESKSEKMDEQIKTAFVDVLFVASIAIVRSAYDCWWHVWWTVVIISILFIVICTAVSDESWTTLLPYKLANLCINQWKLTTAADDSINRSQIFLWNRIDLLNAIIALNTRNERISMCFD